MYFSISRHATILSKLNKVAPLPTSCAMSFWPYSSRVHSCVTVNSIAIAEGGNGRTQEFLLGGEGDFGSERTVVSRSLLAQEILLCEQRRTDHRRVPKNNYIFEYPWNLV